MCEFQSFCQNGILGLIKRSWSGWHQVISAAETIILLSLIGIICSTGLAGNIVIVFTIISLATADLVHIIAYSSGSVEVSGFLVALFGQMQPLYTQYHYDSNEFGQVYTFPYYNFLFSFTINIFICCILILCYTWKTYQQNKKAGSYTTSIPRQRFMRLTKMVLVLISVPVVSTTRFHVIQLMNLQGSQPTLTFCVSYYIPICLSYASSSINPFLYILLSGNFQKHLQRCTNMEFSVIVRTAGTDSSVGGGNPNLCIL